MSASLTNRPAASSGLFSAAAHAPVPLERVRVDAHVVDAAARVTIRQSYRNAENVPLEVIYTFPLDEGAAVCAFEAVVDGVRYVGRAMERDEAFKTYDEALEAGHGGYLLDEERADVFTASLGNLRPGAAVELAITYVTELAAEGEAVRFTLPTTVSPRYAPAGDQQGVGPTPADTLNPPVAFDVPYRFAFEMSVIMSGALRSVQSPTHPVEVALNGARATVRLAQREAAMDHDLVIVLGADHLAVPHAVVERSGDGAAVLVSFLPKLEGAPPAAEVIFVVDRSGSMGGSSIEEVRNALQLCLRSLTPGTRFNIVSFGSRFTPLFEGSRPYDDASLAEASAFVRSMDADMGGTEILPALQYVVQQPLVAGMARQVLVLTDGEVTNTDAVIDLARRHVASARVFTFGIGAGASHHLVKGLARASRGAAEFIAPGERIEAKVMRQFARVFAPAMTDVRVDWGQAGLTPASDRVPPVFDGERVRVYALGGTVTAGLATLHASVGGRAVAFEIPIDPSAAVEGDTIATLAARERIRALEEEGEYLESRGSLQRRARAGGKAAAEIAALGVKYQLASRETSFVAVEHRDAPLEGRAELRRVPVALTSGWGGLGDRRVSYVCAPSMDLLGSRPMAAPAASHWHGSVVSHALDACSSREDDEDVQPASMRRNLGGGMLGRLREAADRRARQAAPTVRPLDTLVALQRADGSWEIDAAFAKAVSLELRDLETAARGAVGDAESAARALATAVALQWLEKHAAAQRGEWDLLARKAMAWLSTSRTEPAAGRGWNGWLEVARRLLG
jgi:Ca-activated chloride channel family protein